MTAHEQARDRPNSGNFATRLTACDHPWWKRKIISFSSITFCIDAALIFEQNEGNYVGVSKNASRIMQHYFQRVWK